VEARIEIRSTWEYYWGHRRD